MTLRAPRNVALAHAVVAAEPLDRARNDCTAGLELRKKPVTKAVSEKPLDSVTSHPHLSSEWTKGVVVQGEHDVVSNDAMIGPDLGPEFVRVPYCGDFVGLERRCLKLLSSHALSRFTWADSIGHDGARAIQ